MTEVTHRVITITSEQARALLRTNTRNRPLKNHHVAALRHQMESGLWVFDAAPLRWDSENVLLDGQHRLHALAQTSGLSFEFLVVHGLDFSVQKMMDQGRQRSVSDQFAMLGLTQSHHDMIAAAVRVYIDWTSGTIFKDRVRNKMSRQELTVWGNEHPEVVKTMNELIHPSMNHCKVRPSLMLAITYRFHLVDQEATEQFTGLFFSGSGLEQGNPIYALRERVIRDRVNSVKVSDRNMIAMFVASWNRWRASETRMRMDTPPGGWTAENFPEPQ